MSSRTTAASMRRPHTPSPPEHTDQRPSPLSSLSTPAASIRRRAKRAITALRSAALIPLRVIESNAILNWRGGLKVIGCNAFLIASLLDDVRVVGVVSSESPFPQ
jgi:hypothetical protein